MTKSITKNKFVAFLMLMFLTLFAVMPITTALTQPTYAFSADDLEFSNGALTSINGFEEGDSGQAAWTKVIDKYKGFIVGISSVCTVTFIVFFILNITKVGASASNPTARSQAIAGVVWTGIAAALLGSVTIWFGFFYTSLQGESTKS